MHLINILLLTFLSIANTELPPSYTPYNGFNKFRPSQNLDSSSYSHYQVYGTPVLPPIHHHHHHQPENPQHPHYSPPMQPPPHGFYNEPPSSYYQKPQDYFNIADLTPPQFQKPLFTPAGIGSLEYPATNGQMNNYNKALQEEAQQILQIQQQQQEQQLPINDGAHTTAFSNGFTGYSNLGIQPAKSFVNVKFGGPSNQQYQYQF